MPKEDLNEFADLVDAFLGIVDTQTNIVLWAKDSCGPIAENMPFNKFLEKLVREHDIDSETVDINDFSKWFLVYRQKKNLFVLTLKTNSGDEKKFAVKLKIKDNLTYFHVIILDNYEKSVQLYDPLTHVYMKESIESLVKSEISQKKPNIFSLIIIDIDNFKAINDIYGHLFGDEILRICAQKLREVFKDSIVGRIGGDEFLIIMYGDTDYDTVWKKVHASLLEIDNNIYSENDSRLYDIESDENEYNNLNITFTAGISRYGIDGYDYETLFTKADKALYRGKRKGKRCFVIYIDDKHKDIALNSIQSLDNEGEREENSFRLILSKCLDILTSKYSEAHKLNAFLKLVSQYFLIDRIFIYKNSQEYKAKFYCGYANPLSKSASLSFIPNEIDEPNDVLPDDENGYIMRQDVSLMNNAPQLKKMLESQNVLSFVKIPLIFSGRILGYIRFDMTSQKRFFTKADEDNFRFLAKVLAIFMFRKNEVSYLKTSVSKDKLTGLLTRDYFFDLTEENMMFENGKYYCIFFNFRNFNFYNDVYGFDLGNKILKEMAYNLKTVFTQSLISRINNDRFVVFDKYKSKKEIESNINKLINLQESSRIDGASALILQAGIYLVDANENNISACIDKAKLALKTIYDDLSQHYIYFTNKMLDEHYKAQQLQLHFREAIKEKEFLIFLQPKIDATNNELIGAEALTRWNWMHKKILQPNNYIHVLEESRLIGALDMFVFEEVCKYQRLRIDLNKKLFPISVNLSKIQVNFENYIDELEKVRMKYDVDSSLIEFEVTESIYVKNFLSVNGLISKFRKLGYRIAIDDFGQGYSNLEMLSKDNFDVIKIDKSLVQNYKLEKDRLILKSVISLSKSLGLDIVVEGVENDKQKDIIIASGGKVIQGYFYSEPIRIDDFEKKYDKG